MFRSDINYPKVSVVVPFYNSSETIDETLCSVEAQTYPSVEIIVVNDGSNEYHSNKLKQILSNRPHVQFVEQSNKGPASARNFGARQASGVYFSFLDSDDVIKPQYLSGCTEVLKDSKIKLVYTKAEFFGAREGDWSLPPYEGLKSILLGNRIPNAVALQRSKDFFELGGFDESFRTHEDWDYWIRLLQNEGDVVCIQDVLFMYRKRSDGTSLIDQLEREPRRIQEDWQKIYDKHRSLYLQHNLGYHDLIIQLEKMRKSERMLSSHLKDVSEFKDALASQLNKANDSKCILEGQLNEANNHKSLLEVQLTEISDSTSLIENQLESANQSVQILKAQLDEMIQLNGQLDQRYRKYKKLWTVRLMKPIIKTEQAISSANKIRKGFRRLIQEKGSLGKAYQFVRRMRKQEGIKAVKNLLRDQSLLSSVKQLEPIKFSVDETQEIVILTTKHTRFVAELIHSALIKIDIRSKILESEPDWYSDGWHIVICPQIFKKLPKHYVAFQMEQSVSSRWFNLEYFNRLNGAESIFDYSIKNIDFLQQNGIHYKKIFYMPIGTLKSTILSQTTENFEYDVLFYGDANNNRRQRYLEELSKRFRVKIVSELFGENLRDLLIKAKVIVNIHYYENALLETTRIYECLSLNKLVVSESSSDLCEHDVLSGVVDFVEIDNIHQMIERIEFWLHHENEFTKRLTEVAQFQKNCQQFEFYFYRFLLAKDVISFDQFYDLAKQHVQPDNDFWCLGLPETVSRAQSFKKDNQYGITVIPALRHQLGWIGCGLSYKFMIRMAKDLKLQMVTICEDDVEFKNDSIPRYQHIMSVLSQTTKPWSVFSGLIADMSPETIISESGIYMEEEKIYKTSKFVSTVFNVYKETVFSSILEWDERDLTWPGNTFDRFLEHHHDIEALVVTPFLVGHKEEIESTLWGHGNEKYKPMIEKSQKILDSKIILLGR